MATTETEKMIAFKKLLICSEAAFPWIPEVYPEKRKEFLAGINEAHVYLENWEAEIKTV